MKPELQRRVQRYGWDYSSPYYEKGWQQQLWPAQERLLEKARLDKGTRVLDVSSGTGLVTFPISKAIGPTGDVLGIDISEKMLAEATVEADRISVDNVAFRHMDAEELELPDSTFDIVINSLGLMYYPNPDKALQEAHRVLKHKGRIACLVWGRRSECGWAEIFPIVDDRVKSDVCPLFFQLGTGENLLHILEAAGFKSVESDRFNITLYYSSDEEAIIGAFQGGAVALAYRKFTDQTRDEAHAEYIESIKPYRTGSSYEIPGEFVICTAVK